MANTGTHATGPVRRVTAGIPAVVPPPPRIAAVVRHVAWVGIVAHASFVPMFALGGHPRLAAFNVLSVALWLAAALVNRRGRSTLAMWLITLEVVAHALLAVAALGWTSGFQYYLIPLIPFVMFNDRLASRTVVILSAGIFAALLALRALAPEGTGTGTLLPLMRYGNLAIPLLALALVTFYFRRASTTAERRMESMAHTDPLTGLLNRRSMEQRLREAAQGFQRTGRAFSVVMADVDRFKRINDAHGHAAGDRVLRALAGLFGERLRGHDAVARWGGEEFLLLLPETDLATACEVADRLRVAVEARLPEIAGLGESVTLTFGVAVFDRPMRVDACLRKADEALYAGKAEGRNRVVRAAASG
ncbi:MAG TPA: GGDEF domain-containing protein [Polyangia bacterium]|nr:GGDEF domain-containing protein [Polyangia bacterium]